MGMTPGANQVMGSSMPVTQSERVQHMQQAMRNREEMCMGGVVTDRGERVHNINSDSLVGVGGDVRNAFGGSANVSMSTYGQGFFTFRF